MSYTKTNWQNTPSTATPLSAENLNHIEQGIYDAQEKADAVEAMLDALQAREEAATAAAMTDTSKVYIYTGSEAGYTFGDWYYYNGSAWVSGGAYNSTAVNTDTALASSGAPADAKAVGDHAILSSDFVSLSTGDDLNDIPANTIVFGQEGVAYLHTPTEIGTKSFTLETILTRSVKIQTLYQTNGETLFRRRKVGANAWSEWVEFLGPVNTLLKVYGSMAEIGTYKIQASDLESGQWSYSSKVAIATRARFKMLIPVKAGMSVSFTNTTFEVFFGVLATPTSATYLQNSGWTYTDGTYDITNDGYMTFIIRNHADTSAVVDPSDFDSVVTIKTKNYIDGLRISKIGLPSGFDLNDLEANTVRMGTQGTVYLNTPSELGTNAFTVETIFTASCMIQTLYMLKGTKMFRRRKVSTNPYSAWVEYAPKTLKILALGNSYTRDDYSYMPFLFSKIFPDVELTFGISYYSGANLGQYADFWANDSAVLKYSLKEPQKETWNAIVENKTIKEMLDDQEWDIVLFQQASYYVEDYSKTYDYLGGLIDGISNYVGTDHNGISGHSLKFGWTMSHLRQSTETPTTFPNVCQIMEYILRDFAIDFIVPCCTAIKNARGTTLNSYGVKGGMCYDDNGHLQEGIGPLCSAYAALLKFAEYIGLTKKSVMGDNTRPNAAWVNNRNIPEKNPSSPTDADVVGISDANCLIAQKCAVQAVKKPYEVSTII